MTDPYDDDMFHDEEDVQQSVELDTHTVVLTNTDKVALTGGLAISFLLILVGIEEHNALTFAVGLVGAVGVGTITAKKYSDARGGA